MEDLRQKNGDWNDTSLALARELEDELNRLSKKYANRLSRDTIEYVMYNQVRYVKKFYPENSRADS